MSVYIPHGSSEFVTTEVLDERLTGLASSSLLTSLLSTKVNKPSNNDVNYILSNNGDGTTTWVVPASASTGPAVALKTATTSVNIGSATAPSPGQILVATNSTTAAWSTLDLSPYATTSALSSGLSTKMPNATNSQVSSYILATDGTSPYWVTPTAGTIPTLGFLAAQSNTAQSIGSSNIVQVAFGNMLSSSFGSRATFTGNVFKNTSGSTMTLLLNASVKSASDSISGTAIVWFGVSSMSSNPGQLQVRTLSEEFAISTSSVVLLPNNATINVLIWQVSGTARSISYESNNSRAIFTIKELI